MNVLQKSSLTVIAATVITSILIISTGKLVADSSVNKVGTEVLVPSGNAKNNEVLKRHNHNAVHSENTTSKGKVESNVKLLSPPPGPFTLDVINVNAPVSPKAPVNTANIEPPSPDAPKQSTVNVAQPTLEVDAATEPKFKREAPSISNLLAIDSTMPVMKKTKPKLSNSEEGVKPSEPIWMQKPPIYNVSSEPQPTIGRSAPRQQATTSVYNVYGTQQQYIYVPMPLYPTNYAYPVMPNYSTYYYPQANSNASNTPKQIIGNYKQSNPVAPSSQPSKPQTSMEN